VVRFVSLWTTWYLVTSLPAPGSERGDPGALAPVDLPELVHLYGLRIWVEQSYKQVKHRLGWSQYQVRGDRAIRRHWELVCCGFCFCWWAHGRLMLAEAAVMPVTPSPETPNPTAGARKKIRPRVTWPMGLRRVRSWLAPWIMLGRWWRAWSDQPPPVEVPALLDHLGRG
jgi:hypothetical protein